MKRLYKELMTILVLLAISTTSSLGGGKLIIPVESPVIPIPIDINTYIGVGLITSGVVRVCECTITRVLKDTTYGASVRAGWNYNDFLALEARWVNAPLERDFSTTKHYGLFIKPQYKVIPKMNVYTVFGYGHSEIEGAGDKNYNTLIKNGFSYGAGVEYNLFGGWSAFVDYQNLFYGEGVFDLHTNILSVGLQYNF